MDAGESEYRPSLRLTRGPFLPNLTRLPYGTRRCAPVHVAPLHCRDDGKRMILGVSCALSDAHTGLKAALRAACNASPWQRCQFHLQQNAGHLVTIHELKSIIASQIAAIFNAESRPHAEERLRVVGLFTSEESLQRLVTAVLVEISEAWESGKSYLKPQN